MSCACPHQIISRWHNSGEPRSPGQILEISTENSRRWSGGARVAHLDKTLAGAKFGPKCFPLENWTDTRVRPLPWEVLLIVGFSIPRCKTIQVASFSWHVSRLNFTSTMETSVVDEQFIDIIWTPDFISGPHGHGSNRIVPKLIHILLDQGERVEDWS